MKLVLFFLCLCLFVSCNEPASHVTTQTPNPELAPTVKRAKNIILMIGDGMGLTQISAGLYRNGNQLNLESFPVVGLHKPYSYNNLITDSAAGATAFSAGVKTNNGAIGVDKKGKSVKSILEEAKENGISTGLISTSTIVHATPASFIAHVSSRNNMEDIATYFLKTEVDFIVGGGKKYFDRRKDGRNLYRELEKRGYFVSDYFKEDLSQIVVDFDRKFAYFTANSDPKMASKGRDYLVPASKLGTVFLNNHSEKGFFLMIEGAQIDWGGHAKNSEYIISEMIDFDRAIGEILEFAKEDGETLVIVTADHETGGYSINQGSSMDTIVAGFTTDYHTASLIPVFAYGPGSELFSGIYENTAIHKKMRQAFGFSPELSR
ncbi:MAG: alkaline phosphatase [Saprospiraceae bacterium]|nr:MAG: alkaline phosphatase [Saprospiraceae bacterium]